MTTNKMNKFKRFLVVLSCALPVIAGHWSCGESLIWGRPYGGGCAGEEVSCVEKLVEGVCVVYFGDNINVSSMSELKDVCYSGYHGGYHGGYYGGCEHSNANSINASNNSTTDNVQVFSCYPGAKCPRIMCPAEKLARSCVFKNIVFYSVIYFVVAMLAIVANGGKGKKADKIKHI